MNLSRITERLAAVPDKRAFCRMSGIPERTVWRILSGVCNPTHSTLVKLHQALGKVAKNKA